jgi:hypothetical protein
MAVKDDDANGPASAGESYREIAVIPSTGVFAKQTDARTMAEMFVAPALKPAIPSTNAAGLRAGATSDCAKYQSSEGPAKTKRNSRSCPVLRWKS